MNSKLPQLKKSRRLHTLAPMKSRNGPKDFRFYIHQSYLEELKFSKKLQYSNPFQDLQHIKPLHIQNVEPTLSPLKYSIELQKRERINSKVRTASPQKNINNKSMQTQDNIFNFKEICQRLERRKKKEQTPITKEDIDDFTEYVLKLKQRS